MSGRLHTISDIAANALEACCNLLGIGPGRQRRRDISELLGDTEKLKWDRLVMTIETRKLIRKLGPERLKVLEISGNGWASFKSFREYKSVQYPEYDVCESSLPEEFDLIIAEQVLEHVLWPRRAARNVYRMLKPGGHFLVTTPFLIRVHSGPADCSRWTETGLRHLLAECGFPIERTKTGSWGNRSCVVAQMRSWHSHHWWHSLRNDPRFPVVVWALAQKPENANGSKEASCEAQ